MNGTFQNQEHGTVFHGNTDNSDAKSSYSAPANTTCNHLTREHMKKN